MRVFLGFILGLLIVPFVGFCVLKAGLFPIQATAKPPSWERRIATM